MQTKYETAASTHPIRFDLFYDIGRSQMDYDDWSIENDARRSSVSSWFAGNVTYIGEARPAFTYYELNKQSKAELVDLFYSIFTSYEDCADRTKKQLVSELIEVDLEQYSEAMLAAHGWHEFSNHAASDYTLVKGYSQGDSVLIIDTARRGMPTKKMIKAGEDLDSQQEHIKNMFYDAPITFVIDITDADGLTDTLYPEEYLKDVYFYDKADATQAVNQCNLSDAEKQLIIDALPNSIEYI